jgi:uncharacterized alkaline shock family protein YloU
LRVVAFIGSSGTGKSHRSTWIAKEKNIEFIIDDGLLIHGTSIVAGKSAKKESTRIRSVKTALFTEDSHRYDVKSAIELYNPEGILILGTSDGMVQHIAEKMGLHITETVYIEDVASKAEIELAIHTRKYEGKHVIPVPTFEIKKDFSGFFLDPLRIFRRKGEGHYQLIGEKSVVRPTFSYLGKFTISDYAIYQIIEYVSLQIPGVHKISRFRVDTQSEGLYVDIDLTLVYGYVIKQLLLTVQKNVSTEIEKLTSLNIIALNIVAKSLILPEKKSQNSDT